MSAQGSKFLQILGGIGFTALGLNQLVMACRQSSGPRAWDAAQGVQIEGLLGRYMESLGKESKAVNAKAGAVQHRQIEAKNLDEKCRYIAQFIREGSQHPAIVEATTRVISQKCGGRWCVPEKDWEAEVKALFQWVRSKVRYRRDPLLRDTFSMPDRTLATAGGDCDDYTALLGAMLMAIGVPVKLRVIRTNDARDWNHIYLIANPSGTVDGKWIALDASMDEPPGWEAPGAASVAKTGKPAGIVAAVRDFDVIK